MGIAPVGSRHNILPRLTPSREKFLRELIEMGVGEPPVKGTARNHLLKLGWIDGVYELRGRQVVARRFNEEFADVPDRWQNVKFVGVTITDAGREALTGSVT